mmetsp:Transcript_9369/g.21886  ORF Transcript_9369/g.21886 Transcript_9369/m.21886 type:complete len:221 (-) Transcript_9369:101-763(-)
MRFGWQPPWALPPSPPLSPCRPNLAAPAPHRVLPGCSARVVLCGRMPACGHKLSLGDTWQRPNRMTAKKGSHTAPPPHLRTSSRLAARPASTRAAHRFQSLCKQHPHCPVLLADGWAAQPPRPSQRDGRGVRCTWGAVWAPAQRGGRQKLGVGHEVWVAASLGFAALASAVSLPPQPCRAGTTSRAPGVQCTRRPVRPDACVWAQTFTRGHVATSKPHDC